MNTNTVTRTESILVQNLNANDRFMIPGHGHILVCERRQSNMNISMVSYHFADDIDNSLNFVKVNRDIVYLLTD